MGEDSFYIRNKPFKGDLIGTGHDPAKLRVELTSVVRALGLRLTEIEGNWFISNNNSAPVQAPGTGKLYVGHTELAFVREGERRFVNLGDLGQLIGARFLFNKDLGVLDMDLGGSTGDGGTGLEWGAGSSVPFRLIYFGNDQVAPASRHFRPTLRKIEKDTKVPVIWIDTEKSSSDLYRAFIKYFEGNQIPHTVLVSNQERVLKRWTGSVPYGKFVSELKAATKKGQ